MDFDLLMDFDLGPTGGPVQLDDVNAELRAVYDPRLQTFSVQLWKDGEPSGIHDLPEGFRYRDELEYADELDSINAFLADRDVRALAGEEAVLLYAALAYAKGGPDWQQFLMELHEGR